MLKNLFFTCALTIACGSTVFGSIAMACEDDSSNSASEGMSGRVDKLLAISNDRDAGINELRLLVGGGGGDSAVTGITYVTHTEGGQGQAKNFTLAQLTGGAVLEEQQGVKALILSGSVDAHAGRGHLTFRYIANGLTGAYKECGAGLLTDQGGVWHLTDAKGTAIKNAKIVTWSMGISTIQGICP